MKIVFVSDIFGSTSEFKALAYQISREAILVDPYHGEDKSFDNEHSAYQFFTENIGIDKYCQHLNAICQSISEPVHLVGFSVGASAIWQLSGYSSQQSARHKVNPLSSTNRKMFRRSSNIRSAICFYGSQIRHNIGISPAFPCHLIFPALEPHFSVADILEKLDPINLVTTEQCPHLHGFMNQMSTNYQQVGFDDYMQWLAKEWQKKHKKTALMVQHGLIYF